MVGLGIGLGIGVIWVLALLLLPVERLWLASGPFMIAFGVNGLVLWILVETGLIAGQRVPVPFAPLVFAACAMPIYHGVRKIRAGWSEWRSERKTDYRPPPGY